MRFESLLPPLRGQDLPQKFGPWQTVWTRHDCFALDDTWDRVLTTAQADADGELDWRISVDSTVARVHQQGVTAGRSVSASGWSSASVLSHTGAAAESKNRQLREDEPGDDGIGRSRGGLTTKTHALVDGRGRPLVIAVTPGQAGDSTQLRALRSALRVPRQGPGGPPRC